ncbi:hypothetical protein ACTHQ8_07455 [Lysinibacillus odysseyi]|uniref:hypothetical protein n=2 Tax=Lysinibacillus odysseyi TaxID=202611 RepID=UPI0007AC1B48|nr:hypothetical protein [Lysinibacillus odysseyi]
MYPVLVVEGVSYQKLSIEWNEEGVESASYIDENGKYQKVYDVTSILGGDNRMDLNQAIQWHKRYEPIVESLNKRIDAHEEWLADLERDHMKLTKNRDGLPFVDVEIEKVVTQHTKLEQLVDGLHEALGIITGEFMVEDVDLSGGDNHA